MMGKTHVAMGMATSLLILHPISVSQCIVAVVGGALGGVIADIDTVKNDYQHDALIGQLSAVGIAGLSLAIDSIMKYGICQTIFEKNRYLVMVGILMYLILAMIGFFTEHRTFTHSLLSLPLFSIAVWIVCPVLVPAYFLGYCSHLALDVLNKKDVPLLFPKEKGVCLKWCYAGKMANEIFMWVGIIVTIALIINATVYKFF